MVSNKRFCCKNPIIPVAAYYQQHLTYLNRWHSLKPLDNIYKSGFTAGEPLYPCLCVVLFKYIKHYLKYSDQIHFSLFVNLK